MSLAFLAQDWITLRGNTTTTRITMPADKYVDVGPFQDLIAFIETSDVSGSPLCEFQTSPTKDDNLFVLIDATIASFVPAVGVATKVMRYSAVAVPIARYFRWKIVSSTSAPWILTWRVWLSPSMG